MAKPFALEDAMRVHDVGVYNWLGGLEVDYGNLGGSPKPKYPILRVYASPERAVATLVDLLVSQSFITGANAEEMRRAAADDFAVLPLPLATLQRGEPTIDPELHGGPTKILSKADFDPATGTYIPHEFPSHYKTDYTLTLWCSKKYTDAFMREWLYAQLGRRGKAENEVFIPVDHGAPWGTILHAMKFTGSGDLSDLEGAGVRYLRVEYTFSLRTWLFKPALESVYPVELAETDKCLDVGGDVEVLDVEGAPALTHNLWRWPDWNKDRLPVLWPREGNATVEQSADIPEGKDTKSLKIGVAVQSDKALLLEAMTTLDDDGTSIFSVSFDYKATGRVELESFERGDYVDTESSADSLILPASRSWKRVHYFTAVRKQIVRFLIAGIQNQDPQTVHIANVEIMRVLPVTKVVPDIVTDMGDHLKYEWFSLAREPHLCIMLTTATSGGVNVVTVEDDVAAPAYSAQRVVDFSVNVGSVFLIQPKVDTLALRVPKTTTTSAVYIQRYGGHYNGHTI
jgi:hypothetical protein